MHLMLHEALLLAVQLHAGTDRDGTAPLPYACHVVEVTALLRNLGQEQDLDVLTAALLHDTVEDTGFTLAGIRARFGDRVATMVDEVTRREPAPESISGLSKEEIWLARHRLFETEIAHMSPAAMRIKLADRISNLTESNRTRKGEKRYRYVWQSQRMLALIPREASPALWDALEAIVRASPVPPNSRWAQPGPL
jgi:guanosine-3',5'-bis(diphosphate) 3'-pyrophosphohydrolase